MKTMPEGKIPKGSWSENCRVGVEDMKQKETKIKDWT